MDLSQRKLTKPEWEAIEVPVDDAEKYILQLIVDGAKDVSIKQNNIHSLMSFMKIKYDDKMETFIYQKYFSEKMNEMVTKNKIDFVIPKIGKLVLKKADEIRLNSMDLQKITDKKKDIYEFILLEHLEKMLKYYAKSNKKKWLFHYFTLYNISQNTIPDLNKIVMEIVNSLLDKLKHAVDLKYIISNSSEYIEKNKFLLQYQDSVLYSHQKTIFSLFQKEANSLVPNLVLYIAPTGTGKTLTPIGLSCHKKIIFVCAARHVGLALAKSAISVGKKIAFAFGCSASDDIRLHYFSAKEFSKNYKSGGIHKVDNSVGDKVEIMICDVKSYLPAMHYMLAFNEPNTIITYWDEPTISMDYKTHELHSILKKNWVDNLIPNMVLSSATLPKLNEIHDTIADFRLRFPNAEITNIESHDCKKTIPLVDQNGYVIMPHYISDNYAKIQSVVKHCLENKTILRYLDLQECVQFIEYVEENNFVKRHALIERNFESLKDINMSNIKLHYLRCLESVMSGIWGAIYLHFRLNKKQKIVSNHSIDEKGNRNLKKLNSVGPGCSLIKTESQATELVRQNTDSNIMYSNSSMCITTKDAFTLTDGPTIYLSDNVNKIAKFCISYANIPDCVTKDILEKIQFNENIQEKIKQLESLIEEEVEKAGSKNDSGDKKKNVSEEKIWKNKKIVEFQEKIKELRVFIKRASLNDIYIPNRKAHLNKWASDMTPENPYTSLIEESIVEEIMMLEIDTAWKVLLFMGIGVFTNHDNICYRETIKKLADTQQLYLIIADSDYIYGTNYQFCHGIIGKDLALTQEKLIQALGRIGRNNIQQNYTIRFRNPEHYHLLFTSVASEDKIEVRNMNLLFNNSFTL